MQLHGSEGDGGRWIGAGARHGGQDQRPGRQLHGADGRHRHTDARARGALDRGDVSTRSAPRRAGSEPGAVLLCTGKHIKHQKWPESAASIARGRDVNEADLVPF